MQPILMIMQAKDGKPGLLDRAVQLSEKSKLKIHILDTVYSEGLGVAEDISDAQRRKFKSQLIREREREIEKEVVQTGIDRKRIKVIVQWEKDPLSATLAYCKEIEPTLVIKQAHSQNRQIMHTPLDWHLIERCQQPLLITPVRRRKKKSKILVALDLATKVKTKAALNDRLMDAASRYVDALGGEIYIVVCANLSAVLADLEIIDRNALKRRVKAKVADKLKVIQQQYGIDDDHVMFKVGQPAKVITSTAGKLRADLTVLGSAGRRGLKGKLLGNTAEQLITNLNTDLLLLRA